MAMYAPPHVLVKMLGLRQLHGCGHEGCVYATTRDTVVKVSEGRATADVTVAKALLPLVGKHPIVPRIYGFGEEREMLSWYTWVEREPLNDLQLGEEAYLQFNQGDLGRFLSGAYGAKKMFVLPKTIPAAERKVLTQLGLGYSWLGAHGFELQDHNIPENWGQRADGTVALRDFGHIYVHPQDKS